jgi:hypothetical protein
MSTNRDFVDNGGTLYHTDSLFPVRLGLRSVNSPLGKQYQFLGLGGDVFGTAYSWDEVIENIHDYMEIFTSWQDIEAMVRLKDRINAQK